MLLAVAKTWYQSIDPDQQNLKYEACQQNIYDHRHKGIGPAQLKESRLVLQGVHRNFRQGHHGRGRFEPRRRNHQELVACILGVRSPGRLQRQSHLQISTPITIQLKKIEQGIAHLGFPRASNYQTA